MTRCRTRGRVGIESARSSGRHEVPLGPWDEALTSRMGEPAPLGFRQGSADSGDAVPVASRPAGARHGSHPGMCRRGPPQRGSCRAGSGGRRTVNRGSACRALCPKHRTRLSASMRPVAPKSAEVPIPWTATRALSPVLPTHGCPPVPPERWTTSVRVSADGWTRGATSGSCLMIRSRGAEGSVRVRVTSGPCAGNSSRQPIRSASRRAWRRPGP